MNLPTVLLGFVRGSVRLESESATQWYPSSTDWKDVLFLNFKPIVTLSDPFPWAVTHIQYRSHFGFLIKKCDAWWKLGFHFWIMPRLGEFDDLNQHVPGTELGWYFRFGRVWRPGLGKYNWSFYGPLNQRWD